MFQGGAWERESSFEILCALVALWLILCPSLRTVTCIFQRRSL